MLKRNDARKGSIELVNGIPYQINSMVLTNNNFGTVFLHVMAEDYQTLHQHAVADLGWTSHIQWVVTKKGSWGLF